MLLKYLKLLDYILFKKQYILFYSYPDFSDNAYSIFDYIYKNKNRLKKRYKFIWLIYNDKNIEIIRKNIKSKYKNIDDIYLVKKNTIKSMFYYLKSKYIFSTHGVYNSIRLNNKHINVDLWHGMPLKKIGLLNNKKNDEIAKSNYTIATSDIFVDIMSKAFGIKKENVLLTGQPRNDLMFECRNGLLKLNINRENYKNVFIWMPTYRNSKFGDIRSEGCVSDSGLPVLSKEDLKGLSEFMDKTSNFMIIKLHSMDKTDINSFGKYKNIKVINNDILLKCNIDLYNLLNEVDVLLTDYSSIYFDFLLLDKPIGFLFNDSEEYETERGFLFEPLEDWMPGEKIGNIDQLKKFILNCNNNIDQYRKQRNLVNDKTNKYNDNLSSKRIVDSLNLFN